MRVHDSRLSRFAVLACWPLSAAAMVSKRRSRPPPPAQKIERSGERELDAFARQFCTSANKKRSSRARSTRSRRPQEILANLLIPPAHPPAEAKLGRRKSASPLDQREPS